MIDAIIQIVLLNVRNLIFFGLHYSKMGEDALIEPDLDPFANQLFWLLSSGPVSLQSSIKIVEPSISTLLFLCFQFLCSTIHLLNPVHFSLLRVTQEMIIQDKYFA